MKKIFITVIMLFGIIINAQKNQDPYEVEMIMVVGGYYMMGSADGLGGAWYDTAPHPVELTNFYISKYEVTQKLWKAVMGNNPSEIKGDNLPVTNVSYEMVKEFITKLNQLTGKHYRLPTEAEWEYAARGGFRKKDCKYAGSDKLNSVAWYANNSKDKVHPVGKKAPNELGLFDMSGNVWEWVNDWYGLDYYEYSEEVNPLGPGSANERVIRGGGYMEIDEDCTVYRRGRFDPKSGNPSIGFRLASS